MSGKSTKGQSFERWQWGCSGSSRTWVVSSLLRAANPCTHVVKERGQHWKVKPETFTPLLSRWNKLGMNDLVPDTGSMTRQVVFLPKAQLVCWFSDIWNWQPKVSVMKAEGCGVIRKSCTGKIWAEYTKLKDWGKNCEHNSFKRLFWQ